ncbi:SDR family oxidoreductase [Ramlibacter sp.]|uniref:SDR family oxidoreductase n=1 Tax=Ramlibacter sp. TaxID=1917967 RepID=UPI0025D40A3E|nr:SDR family oxidoreductase [Ramlibacter sp.]
MVAASRNLDTLNEALRGVPGRVEARAVDAGDAADLARFFHAVGAFDHLVLTLSGGEGAGPFESLDLQALRRGFEAKSWPQLAAAQCSLPTLRAHGSITFITAISARIARPGTTGLAAINGALEAMVGGLARELAPRRVNAVSPGVVDTPWWDRMPADAKAAVFAEQRDTLPVGRVGRPDDVAHAIQYLMENGFTTGTVAACDGGLHLL